MRRRRWLSAIGALSLTANTAAMLNTAPAFAEPEANASPSASASTESEASPDGTARHAAGSATDAAEQTALAAPGKPTGFSAAPGDGTLTLTFQVADDGGSPITGYDYSTDNGTSWRQLANVTGTTTKQATVTHESHGGNMPLG